MSKFSLTATAVLALTLAGCGGPAYRNADAYDQRALSELHEARINLDRRDDGREATRDENDAITAIDHAIVEIRHVVPEERHGYDDYPPTSGRYDRGGGLHHTLELLDSAQRDLNYESPARGWRIEAIHYIDDARRAVNRAIDDRR